MDANGEKLFVGRRPTSVYFSQRTTRKGENDDPSTEHEELDQDG